MQIYLPEKKLSAKVYSWNILCSYW